MLRATYTVIAETFRNEVIAHEFHSMREARDFRDAILAQQNVRRAIIERP